MTEIRDQQSAISNTLALRPLLLALSFLSSVLLAPCSFVAAQQTGKIIRVGYLDNSTATSQAVLLGTFRHELSKLGWIEGKNITIQYRFAEQKNDRLPDLAAELVRLKVDLIVIAGGATSLPAKRATKIGRASCRERV